MSASAPAPAPAPAPASSSSHPPPSSGSSGPATDVVMMRVLCLHGADHSGMAFRSQLSMLEERLYTRHGIELVYVDSPLCGREDDGGGGGDGDGHGHGIGPSAGEAEADGARGDEVGDGDDEGGQETGGGVDAKASPSASTSIPEVDDAAATAAEGATDDALVPRDPSRSSGENGGEEGEALLRRPPPFLVRRWFNRRPTPVVSAANNGGKGGLGSRRRSNNENDSRSVGSDDGGEAHQAGGVVGDDDGRCEEKEGDRQRSSPSNPCNGDGVAGEDLGSGHVGRGKGGKDADFDVGDDALQSASVSNGDVHPPGDEGEGGCAPTPPASPSPPPPPPPPPPDLEYVGLDASLLHVSQVWNRERRYRPFRGIMAFDQGAALAGVLPLIEAARLRRGGGRGGVGLDVDNDDDDDDDDGDVDGDGDDDGDDCGRPFLEGLDFLVLSSGYVLDPPPTSVGAGATGTRRGDGSGGGSHDGKHERSPSSSSLPAEFHLREDGVVDFVSTLHLIGTKDEVVGAEESRRLARRFANAEVYEHPGGHTFPTRPRDLNVIGKFLVERKKDLLFELGSDAQLIFEMRQQLRLLEETATSLVTSTVGMDPPRALMAVIAPNAVGGWTGPKLRDPTDGGGAPCPPEFVMRRDERPRGAAGGAKKCPGGAGGNDEGEVEGNGDGQTDKSENYRDASREHPSASPAATRP